MKYRGEIDGLRSLALLPVIFFHAGFQLISGGFVGVDVFFVISGYLITSILLNDLRADRFSIIHFYERRARRILPALFLVMLVCLPLAWLFLLPSDMESFSNSLIAVSFFLSNVMFWQTSGYFDTATELKPLIHTWSLAVEEQYYVLFPLFLLLAWRLGRWWIAGLLAVIAILSLAAAQWGSVHFPSSTFYLLPTRAWELIIGALVALYYNNVDIRKHKYWYAELGSLLGFSLILYAVFTYSKHTPFPSLYAIAPTVGSALIIIFATHKTLIGKLLGSKPFVGLGLISYSSYLWHQPLFAFARIANIEKPGSLMMFGLSVITLALAYLTWRFVERPFRNKHHYSRKQVFIFSCACSAFFIFVGGVGNIFNGFPQRYSAEQQVLLDLGNKSHKETMGVYGLGRCFIDYEQSFHTLLENKCVSQNSNFRKVVVFGDSEAAHLMHGVRGVFPKLGFNVQQWTATSCRAISYSDNDQRCQDFYSGFVHEVIPYLTGSDVVIISNRWIGLEQRVERLEFIQGLRSLFLSLRSSGARVIVVGNTPEFAIPPQHIMVRNDVANTGLVYLNSDDITKVNAFLKIESEKYGWIFFDPSEVLCDVNNKLRCKVANNGKFYYLDGGHLSPVGSTLIIQELISKSFFTMDVLAPK